jgi:hypothetical protein
MRREVRTGQVGGNLIEKGRTIMHYLGSRTIEDRSMIIGKNTKATRVWETKSIYRMCSIREQQGDCCSRLLLLYVTHAQLIHLSVNFDHYESTDQHVEQAAEDEGNECAAHDNDIVRHAKVWRREVDQQCRRIDTPMRSIERNEHRRREIPPALRIRRVLRVSQKSLADPEGEVQGLVRRQLERGQQQRRRVMWPRRRVRHVRQQ